MPPAAKGLAKGSDSGGGAPPRRTNSRQNESYVFLFSGSDRISFAFDHSLIFSAASGLALFLSGCHFKDIFLCIKNIDVSKQCWRSGRVHERRAGRLRHESAPTGSDSRGQSVGKYVV